MTVHAWAAYLVGALLLIRIGWGIVGPRYARFSDFVYAPGSVLSYFWSLLSGHAKRYVGHSPAGGAIIWDLAVMVGRGEFHQLSEKWGCHGTRGNHGKRGFRAGLQVADQSRRWAGAAFQRVADWHCRLAATESRLP